MCLTYILKKAGKDHHLIKGTFISILSLGGLIGGQKFGILKKFGLTKTFYSAIWNHLVYGLVSAQAIVLLADPSIFASSNEINKETYRQVKRKSVIRIQLGLVMSLINHSHIM